MQKLASIYLDAFALYGVLHIGRVAYTHTYVSEVGKCARPEGGSMHYQSRAMIL